MGSFNYSDNYSGFDNLLKRSKHLTEARQSPYAEYHGSFGPITGKMRAAGFSSAPLDTINFIRTVLYNLNILNDEELAAAKRGNGFSGKKNALLQVLAAKKDVLDERADEIAAAVEGELDTFIRSTTTNRGRAEKYAAQAAAEEVRKQTKEIRAGKDVEDALDDALGGPLLVGAAIAKVLGSIEANLGSEGFDIEQDALDQVGDYVDRIETVDQLSDFVRQIAKEPGYQKIALYLSAAVKPLKGAAAESEEEGPYEVNEPGGPGGAYAENETGQNISEIEDEEEVISREGLNNNMRKRRLLFEKKKNWMKGAVKKPGALNAAAKSAGESKSEYCASPPSGKAEKRCNLWKTFNKHRPEDEEKQFRATNVQLMQILHNNIKRYGSEEEAIERLGVDPAYHKDILRRYKKWVEREASFKDIKPASWFNETPPIGGISDENEEDTEKERRYEDRWDKDLDREREREGSSSAGEYSDVDKDDFCGPAGGAAPGTYPVNSEKRARAALSYAHNAPDPEGIKRCVYRKAKEHGWFDEEEDEEYRHSPMLDSHKTNTSGYLTEQVAKDKRNKIKPRTENQSFKEHFKPKTHWQLQELKRRGL